MTPVDLPRAGPTRADPGPARREMARQHAILWRERRQRLSLTCVAFVACAIFLPVWICVLCAAVNILSDIASMRMMRGLDPHDDRRTHRGVLLLVFVIVAAYCLPAGLIWQMPDPSAKAFALGMVMIAIIHLTTVRAICLAHGVAGFAALGAIVGVSNTVHWLNTGDLGGLVLSSVIAAAGLGYGVTAMISNHRLHRAAARDNAAAEQADAAKSRFLAQMSHELRTPLNAILGIGRTEMRQTADRRTRDRLAVLVRAAEGLGVVLDDLLDMSAIQAGRLSILPGDDSPAEVIAATISLFELQAAEAGLSLAFAPGKHLPGIARFDAQRLRQCLSNLISNALKYTTSGGVTLHADCPPGAPRLLQIRVSDTGPGIPGGAESRIFEPFMRAGGQVAGTGLGLAISRELARGMGGDLQLLPSAAGQTGAQFLLTIALQDAVAAAAVPDAPAILPKGLRVLVVDDVATNRLVAEAHLANLGATVLCAASGAEALAFLAVTQVDLVLLDMNMPDPDGLETFRRLRASAGPAQQVPVIAMTADALPAQRDGYLAAGLNGYLAKPFAPATLVRALQAALARARPPA